MTEIVITIGDKIDLIAKLFTPCFTFVASYTMDKVSFAVFLTILLLPNLIYYFVMYLKLLEK